MNKSRLAILVGVFFTGCSSTEISTAEKQVVIAQPANTVEQYGPLRAPPPLYPKFVPYVRQEIEPETPDQIFILPDEFVSFLKEMYYEMWVRYQIQLLDHDILTVRDNALLELIEEPFGEIEHFFPKKMTEEARCRLDIVRQSSKTRRIQPPVWPWR